MKILIFQTAFIGDVILCTPMITALKDAGHEVSFLLKPEAADILQSDEKLHNLHVFDKRGKQKGLSGIKNLLWEIKDGCYDAAIIPHRSIRSAFIVFAAGIKRRIGFNRSAGSFLFTDVVKYDREQHEILRNLSLVEKLGIPINDPKLYIALPETAIQKAESFLKESGVKDTDVLIGVGPGSKWFTKQWGVENYKTLTEELLANDNVKVVCFGGKEDIPLCEEIAQLDPEKVIIGAGKLNLKESAAVIKKTKVIITNDNGLMHLTTSVDVPVVAAFGPTVPAMGFSPWGEKSKIVQLEMDCRPCSSHGTKECPEKHFRCMKDLKPDMVYEEVMQFLNL